MSADAGGDEVLIANVGGDYYAIGAICRHEQWDLSEGNLQGSRVVCAGHGAVWDLKSGKAVFEEQLEDEPVYDVKVEGGYVYVRAQ